MDPENIILIFKLMLLYLDRKEPKAKPKNSGDTNVVIIINGDINH